MENKKYVAIWQAEKPNEFVWINEIFGPYIKEHVFDTKHEFVCDDAILFDAFIHCFDTDYYKKFQSKNAYLVHFLDENYDGGYDRYMNFKAVFRKHWSSGFVGSNVFRLPLGYCNGFSRESDQSVTLASQRKYAWSFYGALNKSSRPDVVRAMHDIQPAAIFSSDGFRYGDVEIAQQSIAPIEAKALLGNTVFCPSPMGNTNLECFRTYEALEAGAIPILESRWFIDYHNELLGPNPLPQFSSWHAAAEFVRDMMTSPRALDALQSEVLTWWFSKKRALSAEIDAVINCDESVSSFVPISEIQISRLHNRVWQYTELLKHQNATSALLRIKRMSKRIVGGGSWRVSQGKS